MALLYAPMASSYFLLDMKLLPFALNVSAAALSSAVGRLGSEDVAAG